MAELPAYYREPLTRSLTTTVLRHDEDDLGPYFVSADTIFFPEGGGQPPDEGIVESEQGRGIVRDVQKREGEIRHYLSEPLELSGEVRLELDWDRRFDHMQHHSGQHLLSALGEDRFGWQTTSFHLQPGVCDVELDVQSLTADDLAALEDCVAAEIRAARAIEPRLVSLTDYETMDVRSRGLPADHVGDVRLVEIAGVDLNTCGGTHLGNTAEIESLSLLGSERVRGITRVFFVCGERARRRMRAHEERNARLRVLLQAADDELADAAAKKLDQLKVSGRKVTDLQVQLVERTVAALAASDEPVLASCLEGADAALLSRAAATLAPSLGRRFALFTGAAAGEGPFLLVKGAELDVDLRAHGQEVAALLGGRGGGKGDRFQGKGTNLEKLPAATALLVQVAST